MSTLQRLLTFLLLTMLCCIPSSYGSGTIAVNKTFNNREIKARVGEKIRVDLDELGSAGYVWKVQSLNEDFFEILEVQTDDTRPPKDITGAPVMKTWLFRLKKAGKSELRFIHYRPWEDEKSASDNFVLRVLIIP